MVTVETIKRDSGTTPERFLFIFDDNRVVSVVDVDKLPYHESDAQFEASMTSESFILDGEEVTAEVLPSELKESLISSVGESTHVGREAVSEVPVEYLTAIQNTVE